MGSLLHRAALASLIFASTTCTAWLPSPTSASTVDATADVVISTAESVANTGVQGVLDAYQAEGLAVVKALPITGDKLHDTATKDAALLALDARWEPAWKAWRKLREANDAVIAARALSHTPDLATLEAAYCALRVALPASARASLPAIGSCS